MNNNNNIEELEEKLVNAINDALEELAVMEVGDIMANTPVDSGTLRRSISRNSTSNFRSINPCSFWR